MIISLIGFMGSGKSTIGKKLAKKIDYKFIDLDNEIEIKEKCSIEEIFFYKDENYFRKIETKILNEILTYDENIVLSLGGGTPCFNKNIDIINEKSISIFLNISIDKIIHRLINAKKTRPLLKGKNIPIYVKEKIKERLPFYEKSNIIFKNSNIDDLVLEIRKVQHLRCTYPRA